MSYADKMRRRAENKMYPHPSLVRKIENPKLCPECKRGNPIILNPYNGESIGWPHCWLYKCRFCTDVFWEWTFRRSNSYRRRRGEPRPKPRFHGARIDTTKEPPKMEPIRRPLD